MRVDSVRAYIDRVMLHMCWFFKVKIPIIKPNEETERNPKEAFLLVT